MTREDDLISRQAVLGLIEHYNSDGLGAVFYGYEEGEKFAKAVNKLPSVNPQEPKTGHWDSRTCKCSECDYQIAFSEYTKRKYKYCPNCGANMRGEQE